MVVLAEYLNYELSQSWKPRVVEFLKAARESDNDEEFMGGNRIFLLVKPKENAVTIIDDIMEYEDFTCPLDEFLEFILNFCPRQE